MSADMSGQRSLRPAQLIRLEDVAAKLVDWLIAGLIPRGMLTGLQGTGGVGKGLWQVMIAAELARRGLQVLFIGSEDSLRYIFKPRLLAAGVDTSLITNVVVPMPNGRHRGLRFPDDIDVLEWAFGDSEAPLVFIDPAGNHLRAGVHPYVDTEVRECLQPLTDLCERLDVAATAVNHTGKPSDRAVRYQGLGSVAFVNACRHNLHMEADDEDEDVRHIEVFKSNIGPTGIGRELRIEEVPLEIDGKTKMYPRMVDVGPSAKSVDDLSRPEKKSTKTGRAREVLLAALVSAGPDGLNSDKTKRGIAAECDCSPDTVWRAFGKLRDSGLAQPLPVKDASGQILEWRWHVTAEGALAASTEAQS
jgi:hypothetical protein